MPSSEVFLSGWGNVKPIEIRLSPIEIEALRAKIKINVDALEQRCAALDQSLSESERGKRSYAESKKKQLFDSALSSSSSGPTHALPIAPVAEPRVRLAAVEAAPAPIDELLGSTRNVIVVGDLSTPDLNAFLSGRNVGRLTPGNGTEVVSPNGSRRPAAESFSAWMASNDEHERAGIGVYVLGRSAGAMDARILRRRLYAHQTVLIEAGSPALTWLLASWNGKVARHGGVFIFSDPVEPHREPSSLAIPADGFAWPKISVVTVSFNQAEFLEDCLRSVLDQNYPNLEYIVIDACSTDGSVDILRRYEHRFDKLVIEPDKGQSDGLTKGFSFATGDILTWINSDDMLEPTALRRAALTFLETGADLVTGSCTRIEGQSTRLYRHHAALPADELIQFGLAGPLDWRDCWEKGDYFFQPEVFFNRGIWERSGAYLKQHLYWAMDWDLWLRFAMAGARIVRIPDPLGVSRVHVAQKTTSQEMYLWQIKTILEEYDDVLARP